MSAINENIVAFDVAMDDGRVVCVQIRETLCCYKPNTQNLTCPSLDNLQVRNLQFPDVFTQGAARHEFGDEYELRVCEPAIVELDNVWVANTL